MAKTRILNLAKELKVDVKVLMQRLKDEMGLQVDNYLSSLDDAVAGRVRQVMSQAEPQMEEKRVGDNIKRRRRVAPVATPLPAEAPEEPEPPSPPPEKAPKARKAKPAVARVVALPPKEALPEKPAPPPAAEAPPAAVPEVGEAAPPKEEAKAASPAKAATPAADSGTALKRQRGKARKKEVPARIISLPTEPVPAPAPAAAAPPPAAVQREAAAGPPSGAKLGPVAKPPTEEEKKGKAKKKTKRAETTEAARAKPVKKREVRERADLYGLAEGEARHPGRRKGMRKAIKKVTKGELTVPKAIKRRIKVGESITVGELAKRMGIKSKEIIKQLLQMGVMANINYPIDYDSAALVASEFGFEVERATMIEEDLLAIEPREMGEAKPRAPVVTIMGHVDHGKTSLLDAIRQSRITAAEAGGITQHIGAYHVELPDGHGDIVFLDTPGHEAFTSMRARGAQVTDLVVLVVAADDGVMEQTREAINHAKAAEVPLVVAVNKIDKPNANPERVKRELSNEGVVSEEWGGDVLFAEVSAKKGTGIPDLLEKIMLQAEVLDLKAPREGPAQGRIIESRLDKGRGPVGTVLVQSGLLKAGDYFVCGPQFGRVRALLNDQGEKVEEVYPGMPAEVQGFNGVPEAGDEFLVLEDERKAKQIAMMRQQKQREAALARISRVSLEKLYQRIQEGAAKELKMVLKADVAGSIEALAQSLSELGSKEIKVSLIHQGLGEITESDIMLASASDAIVVGFNVRSNPKAMALAEQEQVDVRYYDIIYKLLEDIHAALEGLLEPVVEEKVQGRAEVRQVFSITKVGTIAGCMILDGKVERNSLARVLRKDKAVVEGAKINSLKRFKDDVKEVLAGYECGIGLDRFNEFQEGDIIEAYTQEKVKAVLEAPSSSREEKEEQP
ncbi:MAG: translation initiation factor IF-2 [Syntrophales bacterium]|nr:translation initiation factor IF-2 [Syntrophales bacterium]MDD5642791.1 translation initiation factor IF-2 [Syntrophales bacterium]